MATRAIAMSDSVTAKLKELAARARGTVQVGFIDSDQAPIAFWNEFGHKGRFPAPPRPFFRTMVANESGKWPGMIEEELKRTKFNGKRTMKFMGEEIEGALQQSIINTNSPGLSPTTLRLRYKFWGNPQDIRMRDVLQAQKDVEKALVTDVVREMTTGKKGRRFGIASGTHAKPLIWTKDMLNSTTYKVTD